MIKALIFDLDGTIVSGKTGTYSALFKESFDTLHKKGFLIFAATGRSPYEFKITKMIDGLDFDAVICLNGQLCYNESKIIYSHPFSTRQAKNIINYISDTGYPCAVIGKNSTFISKSNPQVEAAQAFVNTPVPPIRKLTDFKDDEVLMFTVFVPAEEECEFVSPLSNVNVARWHPFALDIVPAGGGKCTGIEAVLDAYGIGWKNVMAFGDGDNDYDMLSHAEIGIAMADSSIRLIEAGFEVTQSVDNDGVVSALMRHGIL